MTGSFADQFEDDFGPAPTKEGLAKAAAQPQALGHVSNCPKCRGTGRFVSYSGRVLGNCYSCKGKGTMTHKTSPEQRAQARTRGVERKAELCRDHLTAFAAAQPVVWAWIENNRASFAFAQSMCDAIAKYGDLTPNQLAACQRSADKYAAKKAEGEARRAETLATAPVIDMTKIEAAFAAATSSGLKSPKLRIGALVISPAKATSANAGALYVKARGQDGTYFGKIMGGKFLKSRDCDAETEALIVETAKDPLAAAIAYGKATGVCSCCGAELTNKLSIELGIGPICRGKWGLG